MEHQPVARLGRQFMPGQPFDPERPSRRHPSIEGNDASFPATTSRDPGWASNSIQGMKRASATGLSEPAEMPVETPRPELSKHRASPCPREPAHDETGTGSPCAQRRVGANTPRRSNRRHTHYWAFVVVGRAGDERGLARASAERHAPAWYPGPQGPVEERMQLRVAMGPAETVPDRGSMVGRVARRGWGTPARAGRAPRNRKPATRPTTR